MAISAVAFSPKEFRVAIQAQTALGTAKTDGMQEINVDSISHGTLGGVNNYDLKSGVEGYCKMSIIFIKIQIIFLKYLYLVYIVQSMVEHCLRI